MLGTQTRAFDMYISDYIFAGVFHSSSFEGRLQHVIPLPFTFRFILHVCQKVSLIFFWTDSTNYFSVQCRCARKKSPEFSLIELVFADFRFTEPHEKFLKTMDDGDNDRRT